MAKPKRTGTQRAKESSTIKVLLVIGGVALLGAFLAAGGLAFAASREGNDAFCASCHTQPESTYYERSTAAQPVDLASAHRTKGVRCIDCHSGAGLGGRIQAESLGAHNALAWYTHTALQPAVVTRPIGDDSCLKCHPGVTDSRRGDNHFHYFLPRWQAVDPHAATCVSCHNGHSTAGSAQTGYQDPGTTGSVCESCHRALGGGD